MKFNQICCVSYFHKWGAQRQFFLALPPGALGRGQKVKYHLISITKSISKIFIPNVVCVLTNEIQCIQNISDGIFILLPGSFPRGGTLGCFGESKTLAWGFAMAPHRLRALVFFYIPPEFLDSQSVVLIVIIC